jgi:hypothetical protein
MGGTVKESFVMSEDTLLITNIVGTKQSKDITLLDIPVGALVYVSYAQEKDGPRHVLRVLMLVSTK